MGVRNQRDESLVIDVPIIESQSVVNGTNTVTISNVAPAGVGTATISKWLAITSSAGTTYYIPMWT